MQAKFNKVCIVTCSDTYEKIRADFVFYYFKKSGADVCVHTTDFLHIEKRKRTDTKENYIMHETMPYKKNLSLARIRSHGKLAEETFSDIEKSGEEYDLLWVILPPNSLAKEAARYKNKHPKTKLVFDITDLWPESMPLAKLMKTPPVKYWKSIRDNNLAAADQIVTECRLFKNYLPESIDRESVETLLLAREAEQISLKDQTTEDKISLCYLGSINNIIDIPALTQVVQAINDLKPVTLHIIGDGEKRDELLSALKSTGAEIINHGKIYNRDEKQKIFETCHYGLNIMKSTVVVGLTMKSIDYFEYGLPVINNIHGDTWDFIEELKLGLNVEGDFATLAIALAKDADMRKRTRDFFVENLSIEAGTKRIDEILGQI